jgi:hypothetical protein
MPPLRKQFVAVTRQLSKQFGIIAPLVLLIAIPSGIFAADLGAPDISAPVQYENFFETTRLTAQPGASTGPRLLNPQVSVSHLSREIDNEGGMSRITHKIHGEAGGRLNLLDNLSLTAVARVPLYTYQLSSGQTSASEGRGSPDLMHGTSSLSLRSELGLNLGKGIDLNLFYDKSKFGRIDRPGLDDQDERFGTRFIIRFK